MEPTGLWDTAQLPTRDWGLCLQGLGTTGDPSPHLDLEEEKRKLWIISRVLPSEAIQVPGSHSSGSCCQVRSPHVGPLATEPLGAGDTRRRPWACGEATWSPGAPQSQAPRMAGSGVGGFGESWEGAARIQLGRSLREARFNFPQISLKVGKETKTS
ncbi:hypothetical protein H1C71_018557 [Ictidomys tridecemlineatus]|nr:hypothetical protein H1C71_018557 [Ictidomys tridecemlineatus]